MHLVGINADNGTVLVVKLGDFPGVPATEKDVVVELVPEGEGGQSGTWDVRYWAFIKTCDGEVDDV